MSTPTRSGFIDVLAFSLSVAARYGWSRHGSMSSVSLAAVVGLALSISVLIIVVSVVNGFERELKERVLGVVPHVSVFRTGGMHPHPSAPELLRQRQEVSGVTPFIQQPALLSATGKVAGVAVNGIDPATYADVSDLFDYAADGLDSDLSDRSYKVLLGARLARRLDVRQGDSVNIVVPTATVTPVGLLPRQRRFEVAGIVDTSSETDARNVYVHIDDARRLFRMGQRISGYQMRLADLFDIDGAYQAVDAAFLEGGVLVRPWTRTPGNLLQAILTQKLTMFVLLSFLVGVAAFNLISGLVMVVDQRSTDVAVLRTLGSRTPKIVGIFVIMGLLLGAVAIGLGVAVGVLVSLALPDAYAFFTGFLETDLMTEYFIGYLPVHVRMADVLAIVGVSLLLTALATVFPAWRASRLRPALVLAHE